ncbi:MAG: LuxR C-terminal-related transcriptional regulator, partial [Blastocatellia bacterium]
PREKEILTLLADGYSAEEISKQLGIALPTVLHH